MLGMPGLPLLQASRGAGLQQPHGTPLQSGPDWSYLPRREGDPPVLRLSKLTDYAVVVMARLAHDGAGPDGQVQTAPGLALATGIAEPTVAKVLKLLGQAGLVEGVR